MSIFTSNLITQVQIEFEVQNTHIHLGIYQWHSSAGSGYIQLQVELEHI